jgi:ABC-type transport system involved in cytochrome c biogenesis permease subunit
MTDLLQTELIAFWVSVVTYSLATAVALIGLVFRRDWPGRILGLLCGGWIVHTVAFGARWMRIGHLPVVNTFEMLSANVWGLVAAVCVAYLMLPRVRAFAVFALPAVTMLMGWMILIPMDESSLPPTYRTIWLYIHIAFLKIFLGAAFVALGIGLITIFRALNLGASAFQRVPGDRELDATAYRCMALALIFDTLGIVAGAIWAQDAWGRYWSWDPLEVWSLVTWLAIGLTLHVRASFRPRPLTNSILIAGTFVVAFFTFFGIPFVSTALHKGAI